MKLPKEVPNKLTAEVIWRNCSDVMQYSDGDGDEAW